MAPANPPRRVGPASQPQSLPRRNLDMNTGIFGRGTLWALLVAVAAGWLGVAAAQTRTFSFAYDQPTTTAYGIAANIFDAKLKEVSGGTMSINQFPGAQLGQEP